MEFDGIVSDWLLEKETPNGKVLARAHIGHDALDEYGFHLDFKVMLKNGEALHLAKEVDLQISRNNILNCTKYPDILAQIKGAINEVFLETVETFSEPLREIPLRMNVPKHTIDYKIRKWRLEHGF
jgi:hypothetical protein